MEQSMELKSKRDTKCIPHLSQYAPVWIVDETYILEDDAMLFTAVFQHPEYGWVGRRYRYDGFNDVLYHKGQTLVKEGNLNSIQEQSPYVETSVADIPNSYGG
ncbi:MAG: hypothetical protein R3E39_03905 [Anaerolineae bacterium]